MGDLYRLDLESIIPQYGVMGRRCEILDPETSVAVLLVAFISFIRYE